jgi:hypothetical protein
VLEYGCGLRLCAVVRNRSHLKQVLFVTHNLHQSSCRDYFIGNRSPYLPVDKYVAVGIERLHGGGTMADKSIGTEDLIN